MLHVAGAPFSPQGLFPPSSDHQTISWVFAGSCLFPFFGIRGVPLWSVGSYPLFPAGLCRSFRRTFYACDGRVAFHMGGSFSFRYAAGFPPSSAFGRAEDLVAVSKYGFHQQRNCHSSKSPTFTVLFLSPSSRVASVPVFDPLQNPPPAPIAPVFSPLGRPIFDP